MRIKLAFALLAGLALAACGDARPRAPMSDGERMYLSRCTGCHAAYEPSERTPEEWSAAVAKMERWKKVSLSPEQRALILGYLGGPAAAPSSVSPEPSGSLAPVQPAPRSPAASTPAPIAAPHG